LRMSHGSAYAKTCTPRGTPITPASSRARQPHSGSHVPTPCRTDLAAEISSPVPPPHRRGSALAAVSIRVASANRPPSPRSSPAPRQPDASSTPPASAARRTPAVSLADACRMVPSWSGDVQQPAPSTSSCLPLPRTDSRRPTSNRHDGHGRGVTDEEGPEQEQQDATQKQHQGQYQQHSSARRGFF